MTFLHCSSRSSLQSSLRPSPGAVSNDACPLQPLSCRCRGVWPSESYPSWPFAFSWQGNRYDDAASGNSDWIGGVARLRPTSLPDFTRRADTKWERRRHNRTNSPVTRTGERPEISSTAKRRAKDPAEGVLSGHVAPEPVSGIRPPRASPLIRSPDWGTDDRHCYPCTCSRST